MFVKGIVVRVYLGGAAQKILVPTLAAGRSGESLKQSLDQVDVNGMDVELFVHLHAKLGVKSLALPGGLWRSLLEEHTL